MELVPLIAVIISAVVLLLQIISLKRISGMRKSISELPESRAAQPTPARGDQLEKRDGDFRRHERRPFHEQRPRQPQTQPEAPSSPSAPPADQVEKSLRDINLRLKNAERDQESARRRVQENFPRGGGGGGEHRQRNRDDRDHRGNRDRDRNRDFGNKNQRFDNWRDRNKPAPSQSQQQSQVAPVPQTNAAPPFEQKEPVAPPEVQTTRQPAFDQQFTPETTAAGGPDLAPSDFSANDLEHGRKIIIKRRPLRDDAPERNGDSEQKTPDAPAAVGAVNAEEETSIETTEKAETDIQFGRR